MSFFPRFLRALLLALLALGWSWAGAAQTASENTVRAVLLFNLLKFAELPVDTAHSDHLAVCVAAGDPELLLAMRPLAERSVRGKSLMLQTPGGGAHCDVIYVDSRARWQAVQVQMDTTGSLTVGLYPGFINDGGLVEVEIQQGRPRFDIHQAAARQAGIRFNPQLLRLARRLID